MIQFSKSYLRPKSELNTGSSIIRWWLKVLPQFFQYILRYLFQVKHQETIQAIGKFRVDVKADDLGVKGNVLAKQYRHLHVVGFHFRYQVIQPLKAIAAGHQQVGINILKINLEFLRGFTYCASS
jgi:hypothetical protein